MIMLGTLWDRKNNSEQVMGNFFGTRINEQYVQVTMHMGMMHTGSTVIPYTKSTSFITEKGCIYCMV